MSEHIWCEDFLVRSFYLKNVQSQETRTLTQFHFLSWPAEGIPATTRPLLDFRRWVPAPGGGRAGSERGGRGSTWGSGAGGGRGGGGGRLPSAPLLRSVCLCLCLCPRLAAAGVIFVICS